MDTVSDKITLALVGPRLRALSCAGAPWWELWQTDKASSAVRDLRTAHCARHLVAGIPAAQMTHHFELAASR